MKLHPLFPALLPAGCASSRPTADDVTLDRAREIDAQGLEILGKNGISARNRV